MKKTAIILLVLLAVATSTAVRADTFKLKPSEVGELIDALAALDGYQHSVDQGPGNTPRIIDREPYRFARETRAKLGADRAVLLKAVADLQDRVRAIRLKISGDAERIDEKDAEQKKAWEAATKPLNDQPILVELSPIAADELTVNDNPIPISVLSVLNRLRPALKTP